MGVFGGERCSEVLLVQLQIEIQAKVEICECVLNLNPNWIMIWESKLGYVLGIQIGL